MDGENTNIKEEAKEEEAEEEVGELDNLEELLWDGPEDSDEEIPEMAALKTDWEIEQGIKFSKRGIIAYLENLMETENMANDNAWG